MLQLRPTFSESWYRVVNLKPKLRGTAQISRQYYRGERWYVVRDAACNQFHRLSDAAYRFVGLLDGRRTVGEAWELVGGTLADDAPTQPEVIQILSQLYAANLVETDIPPDATVLLRRHKKQTQRKLQGRLMNVLFPRIPIWDCDMFLCRWMPLVKQFFSRLGAIIWLVVVGIAIAALLPHWMDLRIAARDAIDVSKNPENVFWLWAVFVLIKFIHECGHAFACRRFGGEVHEMGIMFLVFVPTPYVDASTAWAFPNKWARMFVGAAGMIVELFVAALCAFVWLATHESGSFISQLAYNAMLIASVSTVVFNANPLLRYDGYYILSDFLEIPNLQMRSREYLVGLIKRHVFRIKHQQPLPPVGQRVLLLLYGICSNIYRVFVGLMIILVVTDRVPVLGVLMAIGGMITWAVVPVVKLFKYLTIDPELHRKRGRGWAFSGAVAALVFVLVGYIRFPRSIYASGIVLPEKHEVLYASSPGWVTQIVAKDGAKLKKGDVILVCRDVDLDTEVAAAEAELEKLQIDITYARAKNPAQLESDLTILPFREKALADAKRRQDELTVTAPIDGYLVAPELENVQGRYVQRGTKLGTIAQTDTLVVRATIEQTDALKFDVNESQTEIRLVGKPELVLHAKSASVLPGSQDELPHRRLTQSGGGDIASDPHDQTGLKPLVPQFELNAVIANPDGLYYAGQGANVRVKLDNEPLILRWRDRFYQLLNSRSNGKWI
ncbi:MAG TPA: efflux RND transporter periplasmic adaptor subunit [Tepidisphaeraceae bacterium]|nr:efflux RND transporter periplasmic adaptor subunit [Tepidisphaeraceae bacterium]